jgi:hypothetical protein
MEYPAGSGLGVRVLPRLPEIVFVSDSGRSLEEEHRGAEGCRGHHVVDHVGKPTGRRRTFKEEYDLFGGEKYGVALKTQRTRLEGRSRRYQLAHLIASASPELGHDDNTICCRWWPLGGPPIRHIHVSIPFILLRNTPSPSPQNGYFMGRV